MAGREELWEPELWKIPTTTEQRKSDAGQRLAH